MKKLFATVTSFVFVVSLAGTVSAAEPSCPPEVGTAKTMLQKKQQLAKSQDVQAPRSLAGARTQDVQAPRTQDVQAPRTQVPVQAPRTQDVQAPRTQDVQAPRTQVPVQAPRTQDVQAPRTEDVQAPPTQDVQAPRGQDAQAPRANISKAATFVKEAEAACKAGNASLATQKAKAAIEILK